jgi:hypothetical protein
MRKQGGSSMLSATLLVAALIGASIATRLTVWVLLPAILFVLGFTVVTGISLHWDSTWILLAEVINVVGLELAYLSTSLIFCRTSEVQLGQARTANRRKLPTRPTLFGEIRAGGHAPEAAIGARGAGPAKAGPADQRRAYQRAAFPPLPHCERSHSIAVEAPAILKLSAA